MTKLNAPNSIHSQDQKARATCRFQAYGIICASKDKMVSNRALAKALGMDPRGLRQVLEKDPHFLIRLRGESYRTEPWYEINPDHSPLVLDATPPPDRVHGVIVGGQQLKLTKGT